MNDEKPILQYRVVKGINPATQGEIYRPVITERPTFYIDQFVDYAITFGYVRGQFHDMKAALQGFISALKSLVKAGATLNLGSWMSVSTKLMGSCDATGKLTSANTLKTQVTALSEMKQDIKDYEWVNLDAPTKPVSITSIAAVGSMFPNTVAEGADILVTGKWLNFIDDPIHDFIRLYNGSLEFTVNRDFIKESDYSHLLIDKYALTPFQELPPMSHINMRFQLHGGDPEGPTQIINKWAYWSVHP